MPISINYAHKDCINRCLACFHHNSLRMSISDLQVAERLALHKEQSFSLNANEISFTNHSTGKLSKMTSHFTE